METTIIIVIGIILVICLISMEGGEPSDVDD